MITGKEKTSIRNFLYLDSMKLKSHSSQIFEGITEYIANTSKEYSEKSEDQRGPVGSGRVIGDILRKEGSSTEYKFLEDYAYSLFEEKLVLEGLISQIDKQNQNLDDSLPYVKVTSRATFTDMRAVQHLISEFNNFGEAMFRVTHQDEIGQLAGSKALSENAIKARARDAGMQIDKKLLESMTTLLKFGYEDLIEADMNVGINTFSAPLKRESLREADNLLIHKYSRHTQIELSMVGMVVRKGLESSEPQQITASPDGINLKQAIRALVSHQEELEKTFMGQAKSDIVIDPIALYATF